MLHRFCIAAFALLFWASAARAETITDSTNHFTLDLPAGWHTMNSVDMALVNGPTGGIFVAGARLGEGNGPYCLLKPMERPPGGSSAQVDEFRKALESGGFDVSEASYDSRRNVYIAKFAINAPAGRMMCMGFVFVGKDKGIMLNCYAKPSQFNDAVTSFDALADAFHFDEGYGYSSFPGRVGTAGLVGAAVGTGVFLLRRMFRSA